MAEQRKARRGGRPPGRTPRREMLIDAALDLFHRSGYRNTSTTDVGAAAGISGPAVYRHFANKEDLLTAVLELSSELMETAAAEAATLPPRGALDYLLDSYATFCVQRPGLSMIWLEERRNLSDEIRERIGGHHQDYIWMWTTTVAAVRPELARAEAHVLAQLAIGLMTSVTFLHLDPRHPGQIDQEGMRRLLAETGRRIVLQTLPAELAAAVHPARRDAVRVT
ncbi:TetR/AcrR family transcriptional regulator [Spongiactinospora sp. 9N601]|uniref:TetR/AcrR family transcriptional regulator n=1 Tax=Spongiactinospora sp. 9N601 TaxID=3375149 RepID=UPI0037984435